MAIVTAKYSGSWVLFGGIAVAFLFAYGAVTIYNNISDIKTDRLNKRKDNPLVTGHVSKREAYIALCVFVALTCLLVGIMMKGHVVLLLGIFMLLGAAYSWPRYPIYSMGLLATILLAVCYVAIPYALAVVPYQRPSALTVISLLLFASALLLAKDYKDQEGDEKTNKRTPLVRYGHTAVKYISAASIATAIVVGTPGAHYRLVFVAVAYCYLFSVHNMHMTKNKSTWWKRLSKILFLCLFALLA